MKIRDFIKVIGFIALLISLGVLYYFRFTNLDMTDIRFMMEYWKVYVFVFVGFVFTFSSYLPSKQKDDNKKTISELFDGYVWKTHMNKHEFEKAYLNEWTIAEWQKEVLINPKKEIIYSNSINFGKWQRILITLRTAWKNGESTAHFTMEVEPIRKQTYVIYDDLFLDKYAPSL